MRVVSGICKSRSLKAVPGTSTRPTTDKVKEAIFNMVGPYFEEGIALDLFAGSGGLGIEALSRGMDKCIFVDRDMKAIQTIRSNLDVCDLSERAEVYRNDAERALKAVLKRELIFDLIFLDPPYGQQKLKALIRMIDNHHLLHKNSLLVAEHGTEEEMPDIIGELICQKREVYGITAVTIYGYGEDRMEAENG
jgi:16S rRNA (guanine966-N2)-methyltransferase